MSDEPNQADSSLPDLREALGWAGAKLDELSGGTVGRVEGVLVDVESGDPEWLLVRIGRFGHHTVLPFSQAARGAGRVWTPCDRDMVRQAPRVDAGQPLTRERELELCAHYGMGEGTGRGAEIAGRGEGSDTAEPAPPKG